MPKIQRLPVAVVNQIAAGEVIERPASVVKELLENSLDAGATQIVVAVEQGGRDLIRVWDNGCGIAAGDMSLAVAPHATSKLETADDLFRVRTFGFRGEALASIASVSHLRLQSRPGGELAGAEIEVRGDDVGTVTACGCPAGTMVEVRNLFYNTPVRRRFLKATQTEMGHIVEAFTRVAVAQPGIAIQLKHNEKTLFDLPATGNLLERLTLFFGRELAEKLLWVESVVDGQRLSGYIADPSHSRANARTQYLFVNGRYIRDRSLQHALTEAYRGLLMVGRYPIVFLFFEVPSENVDVNVHPTKIEVRFRDPQQQFRQLLATLRQKFLSTDLTPRLEISVTPSPSDGNQVDSSGATASLEEFFSRGGSSSSPDAAAPAAGGIETCAWPGHATAPPANPVFQLRPPPQSAQVRPLPFQPVQYSERVPDAAKAAGTSGRVDSAPYEPTFPSQLAALQIHNSYIVVETADGLMVIDQHALHERVLYEEIRSRVLAGHLESQRLLVPEIIELSAAEAALVTEHRDVLEPLGMTVEPFGGTSVALHTYPAMLANLPADRMFRDVVDCLVGGSAVPSRRDLLDRLLHMISCKAAVKAGQRLNPEEIQALVAQHHLAQDSHHCPHGRPTALVFSKAELEKQFKRT